MSDSLSRRRLLQIISRSARLLVALPFIQSFNSFRNFSLAATPGPKGGDMNTEMPTVDPYRLPRHVLPRRYDLRLEPDLATAIFTGRETVTVEVTQLTRTILLNAVDLTIASAVIEDTAGSRYEAAIKLDDELQRCELAFSRSITPGEWRLHLMFQGQLNDHLRGFYRSTYKDHEGDDTGHGGHPVRSDRCAEGLPMLG